MVESEREGQDGDLARVCAETRHWVVPGKVTAGIAWAEAIGRFEECDWGSQLLQGQLEGKLRGYGREVRVAVKISNTEHSGWQ